MQVWRPGEIGQRLARRGFNVKAYKLVRQNKDGSLHPLFIDRKVYLVPGIWMKAKEVRTPGYAYRPGWHCCVRPEAPHLSTRGRVWVEIEIEDYRKYDRPESQGGAWFVAKWMKINKVMEVVNA